MSDRIEKYRELRQRLRAMEQSDWFRETYASNRADPAIATCTSCVERDAEIEKLQDDIQHWISSIRTDMDKLGLYSKQQGFFIGRLLHLQHILRGEVDDE